MAEKYSETIRAKQVSWATDRAIRIDQDRYCYCLDDNLFQPLSACARREFAAGDGAELGKEGVRGKMQALHSSSALACNFFDYWRGRDLEMLGKSFGLDGRLCGLAFEQKYPAGLKGKAPNLDVVLYQGDGGLFAIESKFTEPFSRSKTKSFLKPKYFPENEPLWARAGLSGCQALTERLKERSVHFEFLDAAQLLKHMSGLALNQQTWILCYLWYNPPGSMEKHHVEEIEEFVKAIGPDSVHFKALTYQELFRRLSEMVGQEHGHYMTYLRERYFPDVTAFEALD